jgi:hypothetical protein
MTVGQQYEAFFDFAILAARWPSAPAEHLQAQGNKFEKRGTHKATCVPMLMTSRGAPEVS